MRGDEIDIYNTHTSVCVRRWPIDIVKFCSFNFISERMDRWMDGKTGYILSVWFDLR